MKALQHAGWQILQIIWIILIYGARACKTLIFWGILLAGIVLLTLCGGRRHRWH